MHSSPDRSRSTTKSPQADPLGADSRLASQAAADRLYDYLRRYPMNGKKRLELALDVLRDLPEDCGPEQAVRELCRRLPEAATPGFPPSGPRLCRTHMPEAALGHPRSASEQRARKASRWSQLLFLLFLAALLALTLFFSLAAQWGAQYVA